MNSSLDRLDWLMLSGEFVPQHVCLSGHERPPCYDLYQHFDYTYIYFLQTSHTLIVGKKMVLLDCSKLDKIFQQKHSEISFYFVVAYNYKVWCSFIFSLNKYLLLFAVSRRTRVHLWVWQIFIDLYRSSPKYCISLKDDLTRLFGERAQWAPPQKCFTFWGISVAFIRYQNAPMRKRNLKNFLGRGSISPSPTSSRVYCMYLPHQNNQKPTSCTPKNVEHPPANFPSCAPAYDAQSYTPNIYTPPLYLYNNMKRAPEPAAP